MSGWIHSGDTYINVDHIEAVYEQPEFEGGGSVIRLASGHVVLDKRTPYTVMLEVWEESK